LILIAFDHCV